MIFFFLNPERDTLSNYTLNRETEIIRPLTLAWQRGEKNQDKVEWYFHYEIHFPKLASVFKPQCKISRWCTMLCCFLINKHVFPSKRESLKKPRKHSFSYWGFFCASHCICLYEIYGLKENKSCITVIIQAWKIQSEYNYNNKSSFRFDEIQLVG